MTARACGLFVLVLGACDQAHSTGADLATPPDLSASVPPTDLATAPGADLAGVGAPDLARAIGSDGGTCTPAPPPSGTLFPSTAPFYQDISCAPLDGESAQVIAAIQSKGGWGNTNKFQIDFSIDVLTADATAPLRSFTPTADFYTPDCDQVAVPIPVGGAVEGESGYTCTNLITDPNNAGDCHLIVIHTPTHKLYEMWRATIESNNMFYGGCLAVWDLGRDYWPQGRGDGCTSADAGGFPMTALLFTADEVKAGKIDHAIRFILPNDRIRKGAYVHPSTHATWVDEATTPALAAPYGTRLRLKKMPAGLTAGAQVVARALMKYGMFLSDGGQIALTAANDKFTTAKWSGLLGPTDLAALQVGDFEMVAGGARVPYTHTTDCVRAP
jgi:serine/threonine-protein kinase